MNSKSQFVCYFFTFSVQTPAPVSNINASPSQYSANVTWTISNSAQETSYITKIVIYLNGKEHEVIARGTRFTFNDLKPGTSYTVGIQTQDDYSQKSEILKKTFTTSKAGKHGNRIGKTCMDLKIFSTGIFLLEITINVSTCSTFLLP